MNLPTTAVRDLVVHGDDLVVGTHGRSFWILDDVTPLRQASHEGTLLYKPQQALRWRTNRSTDTPLPPEEPAAENPPDGAVIDYQLADGADEVSLQIFDSANKLVRSYSSRDQSPVSKAELEKTLNVPVYWVRPFHALSSAAGFHRFVWDLHTAPPQVDEHEYPIAAIVHDTPRFPLGVYVLPGSYRVELKVDGKVLSQKLEVKMDPRVRTTMPGLTAQFVLSSELKSVIDGARRMAKENEAARSVLSDALQVYRVLQGSDNAPTSQAEAAARAVIQRFKGLNQK